MAIFFQEYIKRADQPDKQEKLLNDIGSKNLAFYHEYYQHGFDPVVCSLEMPLKISTSLVSTGPVAIVNAVAEYPNKTVGTISTTVVLNNDGLQIDSITCPGIKGNLSKNSAS